MARGMQAILGLGIIGVLLVLGSGHLGESRPGRVADRANSLPADSSSVAPNAAAVDEADRPASPAIALHPRG